MALSTASTRATGKRMRGAPPPTTWTPYRVGEMRDTIIRELRSIATGKGYRRERGLEATPFKDVKGNEHWQLYATIELMEMLAKRLDNIIRFTCDTTTRNLAENSTALARISEQIKTTEYTLKTAANQTTNTMVKSFKQEASQLKKITDTLNTLRSETGRWGECIRGEGREHRDTLKREILDATTKIESSMSNNTTGLLSKMREILDKLTVQITEGTEKLREFIGGVETRVNNRLTEVVRTTTAMGEQLNLHRDTMTNILEDQQNAIVGEVRHATETINAQTNTKGDVVIERINALAQAIDALAKSTAEQINRLDRVLTQRINETAEASNKMFKKEVGEIRDVLSSVRSDIEIQKHLMVQSIEAMRK